MSESFEDQLSRVKLMASGEPTWDLSPNDCAALSAVLANFSLRAERIAELDAEILRLCATQGVAESSKYDKLKDIHDSLAEMSGKPSSPGVEYRRGFMEGRAFEVTTGMPSHPAYWDRSCHCDDCQSC